MRWLWALKPGVKIPIFAKTTEGGLAIADKLSHALIVSPYAGHNFRVEVASVLKLIWD